MKVLFLTLLSFNSIKERTIYTDLLREFMNDGIEIFAISPLERRQNLMTHLFHEGNATILRLEIGNTQKTNTIEKGISTVLIEEIFKNAIKKYFSDVKFDLVLYSTPPITLVSAIEYVKKRDGAKTYLLLKDIFPQNAVDLDLMSKSGPKGLLYQHFRNQEKRLYRVSDRIGCMSQANVDYVLAHNPEVNPSIVEVCPNSIDVVDKSVSLETREQIRSKYNIPQDKKVFIYGGNLGRPQSIPFLIKCLKKCQNIEGAFFLIVGDGTDYHLLKDYVSREEPEHVKLMKWLPKEDYDTMVGACDVGMIFLDHRFTIPNFPSRLLAYMQAKLPVLAVTDPNTDVGKVILEGGFGWWCESNNANEFAHLVEKIMDSEMPSKEAEFKYLNDHYSTKVTKKTILDAIGYSEDKA